MKPRNPLYPWTPVILGIAVCAIPAQGQFTNGHIVALQVGDGTTGITDAAQPIFMDEYDLSAGVMLGGPHALPSFGLSAVTLTGVNDGHDGLLRLSSNGQYLTLGGYRADAGSANPVNYSAADVNRVIARIDSHWIADTSTALNSAYDHTNICAVVSDTGQRFWTAGSGSYTDLVNGPPPDFTVATTSGGLRYVSGVGATSSLNISQTQTLGGPLQPDSMRGARIANGQLYITTASHESFGNRGAFATTDPLPTSGPQTMIPIINNTEGSGSDPTGKNYPKSDAVFLDLNPAVPGIDTIYSTGGKADYEKWSLVNGTWIKFSDKKSLVNSSEEINALEAIVNGSTVTLFAATDGGIYKLVDTNGWNADFSSTFPGSYFIAAPAGTQFRGIAVVPEPVSVLLMALGGAVAIRPRRARKA
ncbi:MAG TPA: hypothetical protein VMC06_03795 [Opitutaceae bacterium]|nr:hypothetical protein [Opitutaceae bacterium]